jgi:hypothetical protein
VCACVRACFVVDRTVAGFDSVLFYTYIQATFEVHPGYLSKIFPPWLIS